MRITIPHNNRFVRGLLGLALAMLFVQCGVTQSSGRGQSSRYLATQSDSGIDGNRAWRPTRQNSIPVTRNAAVEKWVQAFQGPLKKSFDRWFARLGHYGPVIDRILDDSAVPRDLIYLAMIESGFNLSAYSSAAASGPWQFIASTGRMYGLDSKIVDERRDLESATRAAAAHLKDLYKVYGDWYLAFAAYNAGPGKVNSAIRQAGTTDYWKLASPKGRYLRQETKDYVPKLLAAMQIVKNYRHYGYTDSNFSQPLQYDRVVLTDATDIGTIAKCARTSSDVIREMNPALIRGITAPDDQTNVYLPKGARDDFRRNYAMIPPAKRLDRQVLLALAGSSASDAVPAKVSYYKVRKGDTLKAIARKHKVTESKIASWNRLGRKSQLKVGMKLKIMKPGSGVMFAGGAPVKRMSGVASIISQDTQNPMDVGSVSSRREAKSVKVEMPTMVAKLGDFSTEAIPDQPAVVITDASDFTESANFDVASIGLRGGETGSSVAGVPTTAAGIIPRVVESAAYSALAPMPAEAVQARLMPKPLVRAQHVVRRGETLQAIALQYKMTVAELKQLNNLKNNMLYANQKLVVDGKSARGSLSDTAGATKPAGVTRLHVVKTAETLSGIAQKYSMTMAAVKSLNNMSGSSVFVGQKLKVTGSGGAVISRPMASTTQSTQASVTQVKSGQKYITHKIKSGETLWTLSKKYQVKILDIKKWNALSGDAVKPNQTLKIMAMNAPVATAAQKSAL